MKLQIRNVADTGLADFRNKVVNLGYVTSELTPPGTYSWIESFSVEINDLNDLALIFQETEHSFILEDITDNVWHIILYDDYIE